MTTTNWKDEFDKLTPDAFEDDRSCNEEDKWLKTGNHLYTKHLYDEPAFTLDKDKIKDFIQSLLDRQKQRFICIIESMKIGNHDESNLNDEMIKKMIETYLLPQVKQTLIAILNDKEVL